MKDFVVVLAEQDTHRLGSLRCEPGLQAAVHEEQVWLRGIRGKDQLPLAVRRLPLRQTFRMDAEARLFPPGGLTPTGRLPQAEWLDLTRFLPVELPVSALPAVATDRIPVRLRPSGRAEKGAALLLDRAVWTAWVDGAPASRLERLRFAGSEQGRVLVIGDILPPLPGCEYWMRHYNLLPAGFDFEFPVLSTVIRDQYNPDASAFLLFDESAVFEKINQTDFRVATRRAVRNTPYERYSDSDH